MKYRAKIDGGSKPNPGKSACAAVFYRHQISVPFISFSRFLGENITNNVAEHNGFILAMESAIDRGYSTLSVESDSKVVVNQFNGTWAVHDPILSILLVRERILALKFSRIEIKWVGRENVWEAHSLVEHELANPILTTRTYATCALDLEDGLWKPIYGV